MKTLYAVACVALTLSTTTYAFHLNPANRSISSTSNDKHFLDKISEPVHEMLTRKAREHYWEACNQEASSTSGCPSTRESPATINDSLIRGVWWSDDPNQDLYKARQSIWLGHMFDAERRAKSGRYKINDQYMMHYRSHYGDMQFLHSMAASDGEDASTTKKNVLMWAEFLYQIATNKIGRETKFSEVAVDGLSKFFGRQSDWQLQWILQPRYRLKRPDDFSEHALGALLHMIQDSFSAAHVKRDFTPTDKCPSGQIIQFLSYTNQNSSKHGAADTRASFETSNLPSNANPIDIGAKIIGFARSNTEWSKEVRPYLDTTIFCLSDEAKTAGPGGF